MARKPIDRRILRTRAVLQHALNSLILKKGIRGDHYQGYLRRSEYRPINVLCPLHEQRRLEAQRLRTPAQAARRAPERSARDDTRSEGPQSGLQPDHVRTCP